MMTPDLARYFQTQPQTMGMTPGLSDMYRTQNLQGPMGPGMQMPGGNVPQPGVMGPPQQFQQPAMGSTPGINPTDNPMMRRADTIQASVDNPGAPPGPGGMPGMMGPGGPMQMMGMNMMNDDNGAGEIIRQRQQMAGQGLDRMQQIAMMMQQRMRGG